MANPKIALYPGQSVLYAGAPYKVVKVGPNIIKLQSERDPSLLVKTRTDDWMIEAINPINPREEANNG
jgi:hypothetical protein